MASWSDKIPQFNSYVQQLPVEDMVKVGMQKQQMYNEGVQKIQTQIDNVAGLDVGRDVDKKYLQSKLDQLGNDLKTVAAGDFSNFQLVNSTAGMANQIAKDPIVQAGVSSSANDKSQLAEMEKDRQSGKLTPQAEFYYQLKRNAYYNNQSLTNEDGSPVSFSGKYVQSWDIDKNLTEAIKSVGDSKWTSTNVFKIDPSTGNPLKDKNGMPIYSEFAIKEIKEGRFSENVSAAIDSVLSRPEAKQELAMRGIYNYRGYNDVNQFISAYKDEAEKAIDLYEDKKLDYSTKMALTTDELEKKKYQEYINQIDSQIQLVKSGEDAKIADAEQFGSLEAYKAALESRKIRNQYMLSGVTERMSKDYVESIPYKVQQDRIKADRDWYMAKANLGIANANLAISQANLARNNRAQALVEEKWLYDPKNPNHKPFPNSETGDFTEGPVAPQELYADLITKASNASDMFNSQKRQFVVDYLKTINYGNGKTVSDADINKQINAWSAKNPNFIDAKYNQWKTVVSNNASNPKFSKLVTMLPQLNNSEAEVAIHANELASLDKDPNVIAAGAKAFDPVALAKGLPSIKFSYNDGSGFLGFGGNTIHNVITPTDIVNFQIVENGIHSYNNEADQVRAKLLKSKLESKFGKGYSQARLLAIDPNAFNVGFAAGKLSQKTISNIMNTNVKINSSKFKSVVAAKEKVLQERGLANAPLVMSPYNKDAKGPEINSTNTRIQDILGTRKDGGMDVSGFSAAFKDADANNINFSIDRDNQTIKMKVYNTEGKVNELEISKAELDYIKGKTVTLPTVVSSVTRLVDGSSNKTTNYGNLDPQSPNAYRTAYIKGTTLAKKFNRTDIKGADVIKNHEGIPNIYIYHHDKSTGDVVAIPYKVNRGDVFPTEFNSVDAALATINKLSSKDIDYIINNSK